LGVKRCGFYIAFFAVVVFCFLHGVGFFDVKMPRPAWVQGAGV
jgi:hypothetical protein